MTLKPFAAALAAVALGLFAAACTRASAPAEKFTQKMVILGFDGMDPRLVEQWMGEGQLPNFARLAKEGGFRRLGTSTSPESPTSWSSFATGANAGKHNVYDFLIRGTVNQNQTQVRNNDVIKKVNGQPINKPEEIFQAYSQLQRDGNIEIEIDRGGRAEVLRYEIR